MPPVRHQVHAEVTAYITRDGSEIRELMHPLTHGNQSQSLAEATIPPGSRTLLHRHQRSEELYHVLKGKGLVTVGAAHFNLSPGDTVCIPPGTPHCLENLGSEALIVLCCCSPPYSHEDTFLLNTQATDGFC